MAATVLAQVEGGENGTDLVETAASATTEWLEQNETTIGAIVGIFAIIGYFSGFFSRIKKIILTILGRRPPEKSSPTQQISTENRTTAASGEGSVAIGGDVSGSTIIVIHKDSESQRETYQPPDAPQLNELPPRGYLPPGSRIPFSPNKVFTGREEDLLELARSLLRSDSKGVTITQTAAVATGLGGVGKTQLAVEFCYRYGRFFYGVHWIQADHEIAAEIAACGQEMDISPWPNELEERTNLTLHAWKEAGPRLLIFDNVDDPASVQDWLPKLPTARLLLTSRSSEWPPGLDIEHHPLGVLPRSESLELLCALAERLKYIPAEDLDLIADRLGDLPLALDLAGNYLRCRPTLTPKEYLAELDEAGRSLLEHPAFSDWVKYNPTKPSTSLVYTFALSWNQLTKGATDKLAGRIFRACGYCAPNTPIPWELLAKTMGAEDTSQRQNLDLALMKLHYLGLVKPDKEGSNIIHPLLAEFARLKDSDKKKRVLPDLATAMVELALDTRKTRSPKKMIGLWSHLCPIYRFSEAAGLREAEALIDFLPKADFSRPENSMYVAAI